MEPVTIKVHPKDNVMVVVSPVKKGTHVRGVTTTSDIPKGHKVALEPIGVDEKVVRYGVVLGYALKDIQPGDWINEHDIRLPEPTPLENMPFATHLSERLPEATVTEFLGYKNKEGYAGTRNLLGITTLVQCVEGVLNVAVARIEKELLPQYPHVDGVVALNHPYGCGVAIDAPEAKVPIRTIKNLAKNPNFGGLLMVVGLGCEKLTADRLLEPEEITPDNVLLLQDYEGMDAMVEAILRMADTKLQVLNRRRREPLPLSQLLVGAQCGGSDAFSGMTGNRAVGYAMDMLVSGGATVLFSEVTEVRDGVPMLAARTRDAETRDKLAREMAWYDNYLAQGGVDRSANPTPGNKAGGLSNIVEKAMGSIAKSGTAPIEEVLSPGERPTKSGMIFAATPASDIVCGPSQLASGVTLQLFITGRGTPYGLAAAPVIKVATNNELAEKWSDLMDVNAGTIATGEETVEQVGQEIFNLVIDVASGKKQSWAEKHKLHNYLCVFNPAPIT